MKTFGDVNRPAASGVSESRIQSYDGWRLLVVGSLDPCCYHDVEVIFADVPHINLPTAFDRPTFADAGLCHCGCCERRRFAVQAEGSQWEVVARAVGVVIGKVFHFDRGDQHRPAERVAGWVRRKPADAMQAASALPTRDRCQPDRYMRPPRALLLKSTAPCCGGSADPLESARRWTLSIRLTRIP